MIPDPKDVLLHKNCLTWSPVPYADGYSIYLNGEYHDDEKINKHSVIAPGQYSVVAYVKGSSGEDAFTQQVKAKSLKEFCPVDVNHAPDFVKKKYPVLAFQDTFNRRSIDPAKWRTAQPWGPRRTTNFEDQYLVDIQDPNNPNPVNPFSFTDNTIIIEAAKTTPNIVENNGQRFTSGVLSSFDSFRLTYGYIESRIKSPCFAPGFWGAFWLFAADFSGNEVDLAELVGNAAYGELIRVWQAYHNEGVALDPNGYGGGTIESMTGELYEADRGWNLPEINCDDFNTYGALIEPTGIELFVNSQSVNSISTDIPPKEKYVIANLAAGGTLGEFIDESAFPARLEIDYIRAYSA